MITKQILTGSSRVEMRGDEVYIDGVKVDDFVRSNLDKLTPLDGVRADYLSSLDTIAGDLSVSQHYNQINAQCSAQSEEYFRLTRANQYIIDDLPTWDEINE